MINSGVAFIASHLTITGGCPVEVIPGHVLRQARDEEIELIKRLILRLIPPYAQWVRYDGVVKEERYEGRTVFDVESLPREKWKYWVVAYNGNNHQIHDIETIATLLPVDFDFAFQIYYGQANQGGEDIGWSHAPMHIIEKYSSHEQVWRNAQDITPEQVTSIGSLWRLYTNLLEQHEFAKNALKNFSALRRVPKSSGLYVVGLFSIVESLITHAPRLTETLDSINHQITNKIILLRKRYTRTVVPSSYFLHASEESIWKKLYSYRSSVAHGGSITFDGELQVLKGHEAVVTFLQDNVRELITLTLREPEFIVDLRRC